MGGLTPTDELIVDHLHVVGHVVRQLAAGFPAHVDQDDMAAAGYEGLVDAARRYDPDLGVPFVRYANLRVKGAVLDEARRRDWTSRHVRTDGRTIDAAVDQLTGTLGRQPTVEEVGEVCGIRPERVEQVEQARFAASLLSLDRPTRTGDQIDLVDRTAGWSPEAAVDASELAAALRTAISELPDDLQYVLLAHQFEGRTLADIGSELGVTEARTSQIRQEALDALRAWLHRSFGVLSPPQVNAPGKRRRAAYLARMAEVEAANVDVRRSWRPGQQATG